MVCPYDLGVPGGVQGQVLGLARALRPFGWDAFVIAPGALPADVPGKSVGRSVRFRVNGSIAPMAPHPMAAARTVRALRSGRFHVVHLHEPMAPSITIPALLSRVAPVVATFHAAGDRTPYRWAGAPLRHLARRVDVRVAVSPAAANVAERHLDGACEIVRNGIDLVHSDSTPVSGSRARSVLFVGRHEKRKGLATLVGSCDFLPPDVEVWIAGEGPETARLRDRTLCDRRVRWVGPVDDSEKGALLRRASIVCAPSRYGESFGLVLLEAMAAGVPVVASDIAGYRELSQHGRAACLVPADDPVALAAGILRVLDDARYAATLRAHGAAVAEAHSMTAVAGSYAAIYQRLVPVHRGS
jgi:phosphatidylinositol alpha-mannosyltransferase